MDLDPGLVAQAKIAAASFFGGTVRLFLRPASSFLRSVGLVFCCVVCGYYFTPMAMDIFSFNASWAGGIGALIGLVGLSIAEALLKVEYRAIIKGLIEMWIPKKSK